MGPTPWAGRHEPFIDAAWVDMVLQRGPIAWAGMNVAEQSARLEAHELQRGPTAWVGRQPEGQAVARGVERASKGPATGAGMHDVYGLDERGRGAASKGAQPPGPGRTCVGVLVALGRDATSNRPDHLGREARRGRSRHRQEVDASKGPGHMGREAHGCLRGAAIRLAASKGPGHLGRDAQTRNHRQDGRRHRFNGARPLGPGCTQAPGGANNDINTLQRGPTTWAGMHLSR